MSKRHKWYREICAWADGAEIEMWYGDRWEKVYSVIEWDKDYEYRIKPQPKEPQYLYVYLDDNYELSTIPLDNDRWKYIGKIKLEDETSSSLASSLENS